MKPPDLESIRVRPADLRRAASGLEDAADQLGYAARREPDLHVSAPAWASSAALARLSLAIVEIISGLGTRTETTATAVRAAATAYEDADRQAMFGNRP